MVQGTTFSALVFRRFTPSGNGTKAGGGVRRVPGTWIEQYFPGGILGVGNHGEFVLLKPHFLHPNDPEGCLNWKFGGKLFEVAKGQKVWAQDHFDTRVQRFATKFPPMTHFDGHFEEDFDQHFQGNVGM